MNERQSIFDTVGLTTVYLGFTAIAVGAFGWLWVTSGNFAAALVLFLLFELLALPFLSIALGIAAGAAGLFAEIAVWLYRLTRKAAAHARSGA
jgi:multisubunit Na+/H+ antiporter MnhG subunit